jgi:hypothetical protein
VETGVRWLPAGEFDSRRESWACSPRWGWELADQLLDHFSSELGELFVAAGVVVGELVVIKAEEVEDGAVDVTDVVDAVDGFGADVVGGSDGVAGFGSASSEPH